MSWLGKGKQKPTGKPFGVSAAASQRFRLALFLLFMLVLALLFAVGEVANLALRDQLPSEQLPDLLDVTLVGAASNLLIFLPLALFWGSLVFLFAERLGLVWRFGRSWRELFSLAVPRQTLTRSAKLWGAVAALALLGFLIEISAYQSQIRLNAEPQTIAWVVALAAIPALLAALALYALLWRLGRFLCWPLARRGPYWTLLFSLRTALPLLALSLCGAAFYGYRLGGEALRIYDLRAAFFALAFFLLLPLVLFLAQSAPLQRLLLRRYFVRGVALLTLVLLAGSQLLALGIMNENMIVRDSVLNDTAYSRYVIDGIRRLIDFDRDGYSPLFGGGDCDDFDPEVNPQAIEIPDNGKDDNCLLGDFKRADFKAEAIKSVPRNPKLPPVKNVLVIVVDAMRGDLSSFNGNKEDTTPRLRAWAKSSGVNFNHAYSPASKTAFSVGSMLFGKRASRLLFENTGGPVATVSESETSLATVLSTRGFDTDAFATFQYFERHMRPQFKGFTYHGFSEWLPEAYRKDEQTPIAEAFSDRLIRYLSERGREAKPFFAYAHYTDPHAYYRPPPAFARFGNSSDKELYMGELLYSDFHLGRLLDWMKEAGWLDDTVVVITADHGEGLGAHQISSHGQNLYQELINVPFLVFAPGLAPRDVRQPVSLSNLTVTLLDLLNQPIPEAFAGTSYVPLLEGGSLPVEPIISELMPDPESYRRLTAVIKDNWKLIYNQLSDSYQLFDLAHDPREERNLFRENYARRVELTAIIKQVIETAAAERGMRLGEVRLAKTPPTMKPLDVHFERGVDLLGYEVSPPVMMRGMQGNVTLYWRKRAAGAMVAQAFIPVHVETRNEANTLISLVLDHVPAKGSYPFALWKVGDIVRDDLSFLLPKDWPTLKHTELWLCVRDTDCLGYGFGGKRLLSQERWLRTLSFPVIENAAQLVAAESEDEDLTPLDWPSLQAPYYPLFPLGPHNPGPVPAGPRR